MEQFDVGDVVRLSVIFTNMAGTEVDPTAVTATLAAGGAAATTYTYGTDAALVRDDAGRYHLDTAIDAGGRWRYRFAGTGANQAAAEGYFDVRSSAFA